ncbi:hypothetical protein E4T48_07457 [Aureobasidium sp. EXF-10727]|nr:hypothetical protein E4T48_07457 [Aureobasidium sp. EXF-10727]
MSTARRASFPPRSPSPAKPQFSTTGSSIASGNQRARETITVSDDDEEILDNENNHLTFTPLTQPESQDSVPEPEKGVYLAPHLPPSPKRRRVDDGDLTSTPQPTPARFILPSTGMSRSPLTQADRSTPTTGRPVFLMASLPPPETVAPLPDAFSPRRRGQKFLPGGLASELQSWVIEAAQTASQGRPRNSLPVDDSVHVIDINEVKGDGPVFVHGTMPGKGIANVLLVDGQANRKTDRVQAGDRVSGEAWTVGVDWRILKP